MNKQEEKALRRRQIIELLLDRPYTQTEICEKLSVSKKTLQDDIKYLNEHGVNIPKHSKLRGYVLDEEEKKRIRNSQNEDGGETFVFQNLVSGHIQKTILLLMLQKKDRFVTLPELTHEYAEYLSSTGGEIKDSERLAGSISNTMGERGVGLVAEGLVELKKISELSQDDIVKIPVKYREEMSTRCYRTTKRSPVLLTLDWDTAQDILSEIRAFGNTYALKDRLKSIEYKLSVALYGEADVSQEESFVTYGNRINRNERVEKQLNKLRDIPFERYAIRVAYRDMSLLYKVGILVYIADKDELYMMGKYVDENRTGDGAEDGIETITEVEKTLKVERISDIQLTDIENDLYLSDYYMDLYEEMFSVSFEPVEHVVIEFDIFSNVPKKMERLASTRRNAIIKYDHENKIGIYEDDVRGLADFSKYLRRYGRSVRVLAPDSLKEIMKQSVDRLEERYKAEGLYE